MSEMLSELARKRTQAERWVNGSTATAVAAVVVTAPIPGGATAALCTIEATMCYQIGKLYKGDGWSMEDGKAAARVIGLAAFTGKIVALEAAILLGPFAPVGKAVIAAGIVKGLGELVIGHFEKLTAEGLA